MNSNSKGRTSSAGGRTNRNCKTNTSKVVKEEVKTVASEKLNQESTSLAPKAAVTTVASKVEVKPLVSTKVVKEEVKPAIATKSVKEEVKPVVKPVVTKSAKEEAKPATTKEVKSRTSKVAKTVTKKTVKTETKKPATTTVASELNYSEILGSEPIKVIEAKDKKSVADYKINIVLKNYNYHKVINALFTEDSWETKREVALTYLSSLDDDLELWGTSIKIDAKKVENFQYAVSYSVHGEVYWDNNYGKNYKY